MGYIIFIGEVLSLITEQSVAHVAKEGLLWLYLLLFIIF